MHDCRGVAEDLHLDVARALDQLFEIDLVVAEGGQASRLPSVDLAREQLASSR
jgi:hypothetical protein